MLIPEFIAAWCCVTLVCVMLASGTLAHVTAVVRSFTSAIDPDSTE